MTRILATLSCLWALPAGASNFQTIGVDQLRQMAPWLSGAGVSLAHPEAGAPFWQVNPAAVSQPVELFTWIASAGTTDMFPNGLGQESAHANGVGQLFYGWTNGVAPGVTHVDSYEAGYFYNSLIAPEVAINGRVVNQSFIFGMEAADVDQNYDNYVARYGTIFVCGAGNGGGVSSPATAYNVIAAGAYGGSSSAGPTLGGRSKPDITAPESLTSFSTPLVAGVAALLAQAAARNDAGAGTAAAAGDVRTIKALLLNGATKPADWTNMFPQPLDTRYGAGVLHAWNSYRQLRGGRHPQTSTQTLPLGSAHPPPAPGTYLPTRRGWDFAAATSSATQDRINHYTFDLDDAPGRDFTATLVWNRGLNAAAIANFDLYLFNEVSGALVASSESTVDNVEHIWARTLPAGRYNLQVLKRGGPAPNTATYALAFEFGPPEAPVLGGLEFMGGAWRGQVNGEPNQNYAMEFSPDLTMWTAFLTNRTAANGSFLFTNAVAGERRLYRAVERP